MRLASGSASVNGPSSASGTTSGTWPFSSSAATSDVSHGLRAAGPHTAYANRRPARSTRRASASTRSGSGTSITPKRDNTPSTDESGRSIACASMIRHSTLDSPRAAAPRRAAAIMPGERSLEINRPSEPTSSAARNPVSPGPAVNSRIVSPGRGSTSFTIHSDTGRTPSNRRSRLRSQAAASSSPSPNSVTPTDPIRTPEPAFGDTP